MECEKWGKKVNLLHGYTPWRKIDGTLLENIRPLNAFFFEAFFIVKNLIEIFLFSNNNLLDDDV